MSIISLILFLCSLWSFYVFFNEKMTSKIENFRFILFLIGLITLLIGIRLL